MQGIKRKIRQTAGEKNPQTVLASHSQKIGQTQGKIVCHIRSRNKYIRIHEKVPDPTGSGSWFTTLKKHKSNLKQIIEIKYGVTRILIIHYLGRQTDLWVFLAHNLRHYELKGRAGHASYFIQCVTRQHVTRQHVTPFYRRFTRHREVFSTFFKRHHRFASRFVFFQMRQKY